MDVKKDLVEPIKEKTVDAVASVGKTLASVKKGEVAADVTFEKGQIRFTAKYDGHGSDATVSIAVDSSYFLDKLAAKIPGQLDNMAIEMIKGQLAK